MKSKIRIILLSLFLGLLMGFFAYNFTPRVDYDLVRHWEVVDEFTSVESFGDFVKTSRAIDYEIIPQIFSLIVSRTGDYNLLQFFFVTIGYSALFYILFDYREKIKLSIGKFIPIFILSLFGQSTLFYFSGLYNYCAINIFALALYIDYIKNNKKIAWSLYLLTPFIHSSMFLPLFLLIIAKIKKGIVSWKFLFRFALAMTLFGFFMNMIVDILGIDFLTALKNTYNNYVLKNDRFFRLYSGFYLFMTITKIAIVMVACWSQRKNKEHLRLKNYICILAIAVIVLSLSSIAFTRFSSLVLFAALPIVIDAISVRSRQTQLFAIVVMLLGALYMMHAFQTVGPLINIWM